MEIALIGYGKMGKEVEAVAKAGGHNVVAIFDADKVMTVDALKASGAKVAIDFTQPNAVVTNVRVCAKAGVSVVIGTTGWEESLDKVRKMADEAGIGVIVGSNFSVGVNLFLEIVRQASLLINPAGYDVYILEAHHRTKKDFPSGTALRLSEAVVSGIKAKSKVSSELKKGDAVPADTLMISSIRAGAITGTHTVGFESEEDTIELTHRAKSRVGFATGSVRAAEWIAGQKGFYRFEEHITDILEKR